MGGVAVSAGKLIKGLLLQAAIKSEPNIIIVDENFGFIIFLLLSSSLLVYIETGKLIDKEVTIH
jgi:hypothetical protein